MAGIQMPPVNKSAAPRTFTTADLLKQEGREFIMIIGPDGVGKSCAVVSVAAWIQLISPAATFYIIDTENKLPTALRSFGPVAPTNIVYYKCDTMNEVNEATEDIMKARKTGDWFATESMGRVWEKAQDMGYKAISGYDKDTYLEKRRLQKVLGQQQAPPIPNADNFWNIVKGAHDGAFIDLMSQALSLNILWTSAVSKPPKAGAFLKENETRKDIRAEFGIEAGIDGAPRLPYYVETLCIMGMVAGKVNCRTLRDNNSKQEDSRKTFDVPTKRDWAQQFWINCRG